MSLFGIANDVIDIFSYVLIELVCFVRYKLVVLCNYCIYVSNQISSKPCVMLPIWHTLGVSVGGIVAGRIEWANSAK